MVYMLVVGAIVASILLILIVLFQNPKGGGFNTAFGGANAASQLLGAANSTNVLEKVTWGLVAFIFAVCLISALVL